MAFNYAKAKATAERLIKNFGQAGTLTKYSTSGVAYSPTRTATTYSVVAAVLDYRNSEIDGTIVQRGDKRIYLSTEGLSVVPGTSDTLTLEGTAHSIIDVRPLSPGGTVVFYEIQARR